MLSSFIPKGPIFSKKGIEKLIEIKSQVEQLKKNNEEILASLQNSIDLANKESKEEKEITKLKQELRKKKLESSVYSKQMIDSVIQICDLFFAYPNGSDWHKEKLLTELENQTNILDNNSGTFVLEVFNKESYSLAKLIYDLTDKLDPIDLFNPTFIESKASKLVSALKNPLELFQTLRQNLKANLDFYDFLLNYELLIQTEAGSEDKQREIHTNIREVEKQFKNFVKGDNFNELKQQYEKFCIKFIKDVSVLPYLKIINNHELVNKNTPITFGDVEVKGFSWDFIKLVLSIERQINKQLGAQNEQLTTIYQHFFKNFNFSECEKIYEKFQNLTTTLLNELNKYIQGEYIQGNGASKFFKKHIVGVNKHKLQIAEGLVTCINTNLNDLATGKASFRIVAFDICRDIMRSVSSNNNVAGAVNIGLGQLSKLLNEYKFKFLDLVLHQIKSTNDPSLAREFNKYENELGLPITELNTSVSISEMDDNNNSDNNDTTTSPLLSPRKP